MHSKGGQPGDRLRMPFWHGRECQERTKATKQGKQCNGEGRRQQGNTRMRDAGMRRRMKHGRWWGQDDRRGGGGEARREEDRRSKRARQARRTKATGGRRRREERGGTLIIKRREKRDAPSSASWGSQCQTSLRRVSPTVSVSQTG